MIEKEQQSQPKHPKTVVALHSVIIHTIVIGTTNVKVHILIGVDWRNSMFPAFAKYPLQLL